MTCRLCEERVATGSLCDIDASDCFTIDGVGSEADPFTISPDISATAGNLITCSADGLLAALPATILNPPTVSLTRASDVSITNNTMTVINFTLEHYDTDTMHSSGAPSRITFTTAGFYLVTFYVIWNTNAVGDRIAQIRKNGTDVLAYESRDEGDTDQGDGHTVTIQEEFAATDYVEAMVQQTSGADLRIAAEHGAPLFTATGVVL